jgi:hypothetical protein
MEAHDEGFARNLTRIFGPGSLFEGMGEHSLKAVSLSDDKQQIVFEFTEGENVVFGVEGDCCSRSWIEHLDVPKDVIGEKIIGVEDARMDRNGEGDSGDDDKEYSECLQIYNTKFVTLKGCIVLEYRNSSNGYYGGYLVRL